MWYVGADNRDVAPSKGIMSWKNKRCAAKNLGITGKRAKTIDNILETNRQNKVSINPKKVKNKSLWTITQQKEFFCDFKTFNNILVENNDDILTPNSTELIFLIGLMETNGSKDPSFESYVVTKPTLQEELRIMQRLVEKMGNNPVFCWHGEPLFWKRAMQRHPDGIIPDIKWVDLCAMFKNEPITVKGCMNFGLKSVVKACQEQGLVNRNVFGAVDLTP